MSKPRPVTSFKINFLCIDSDRKIWEFHLPYHAPCKMHSLFQCCYLVLSCTDNLRFGNVLLTEVKHFPMKFSLRTDATCLRVYFQQQPLDFATSKCKSVFSEKKRPCQLLRSSINPDWLEVDLQKGLNSILFLVGIQRPVLIQQPQTSKGGL